MNIETLMKLLEEDSITYLFISNVIVLGMGEKESHNLTRVRMAWNGHNVETIDDPELQVLSLLKKKEQVMNLKEKLSILMTSEITILKNSIRENNNQLRHMMEEVRGDVGFPTDSYKVVEK